MLNSSRESNNEEVTINPSAGGTFPSLIDIHSPMIPLVAPLLQGILERERQKERSTVSASL